MALYDLRNGGDRGTETGEGAAYRGRVLPSAWLLTSDRGRPWAKDSLTDAFWRSASKLGIGKDLPDLRGNAITRFINAGLSDEQVAEIVGWEPTGSAIFVAVTSSEPGGRQRDPAA